MNSPAHTPAAANASEHKVSNFLRQIIEKDLEQGTYASRRWAGSPGDAAHHATGQPDPAKIRTRFPPEPNGYLHVGHAKSICLNFGLARDYGGVCHMRFDDTNPEKEEKEYVDSILDAVQWLGFNWQSSFNGKTEDHLYYASKYFDFMYRAAAHLITAGHAVLRAKIDMAAPNINMRDPAIYRIRRATHHNTGDAWCIYPMYTFAHPIEDALEQITHSIATLEFEDQRPFYDWLLERLCEGGLLKAPPPRQYEFARLNLTYVITSKRKLAQLVNEKKVSGWDDPRMPTIVGLRRRGYTPEAIQLFAERIGVTKADSWIDYSTLEGCLREDLENKAHRGMAVLDPVKLVLTNWDETRGAGHLEPCTLPALPHAIEGQPEPAARQFVIGKEVWIERDDFAEVPPKGYKRLTPGAKVRLKGGYVVECTGCAKDAQGNVTEVHATVFPETKSGTPGSGNVKAAGVITWVAVADAVPAEVRLYDRLFSDAQPDAGGKNFLDALNPNSLKVVTAYVEPSLAQAQPDQKFQFERIGYFVADRKDHVAGTKPVFNLAVGLKDSW